MEYLSTYGWALLLIGVVFILLYEIGFPGLSSASNSLHGQPGSCKVMKQGSILPSLVGICNNQEPQFVASFNPGSGSFMSANLSQGHYYPILHNFSLSMWFEMQSPDPPANPTLPLGPYVAGSDNLLYFSQIGFGGVSKYGISNTVIVEDTGGNFGCCPSLDQYTASLSSKIDTIAGSPMYVAPTNGFIPGSTWVNFQETMTGNTLCYYINGAVTPQVSTTQTQRGYSGGCSTSSSYRFNVSGNNALIIGGALPSIPFGNGDWPFEGLNGSMSNIQMYNITLTANEVTALYDEGIGGVPVSTQGLVGWWPLNGNGNDYGGNGYNLNVSNGIVFSSQWTSGYVIP